MILGLDISTTMVGVALIDSRTRQLVKSASWDISKNDTLFSKGEEIGAQLYTLRGEHKVGHVFIETALKKFLPG